MQGLNARAMIEADQISKSYGSVRALNSVSIAAPQGTVLALLGHNGSGKTTLINILAGAFPPDSGRATVAGFDVVTEPHEVRKRFGLTGQFASVDGTLSGRGNLILIARLLGADRRSARARADELLEDFGLGEYADRRAGGYSGGMRRRLDIAMSLVGRPEVIFLDEPTAGLDLSSRIELWDTVEKLVAQGTTVLLTTQYLEEADRLAHSIVVLSAGVVVASGTPAELKSRAGQRTVTIRFATAELTSAARDVLTLAGLGSEMAREPHTIVAPTKAAEEVARVIMLLDQAAITTEELTFGPPSLDDVYLALAADADGLDGEPNEPPAAQPAVQ